MDRIDELLSLPLPLVALWLLFTDSYRCHHPSPSLPPKPSFEPSKGKKLKIRRQNFSSRCLLQNRIKFQHSHVYSQPPSLHSHILWASGARESHQTKASHAPAETEGQVEELHKIRHNFAHVGKCAFVVGDFDVRLFAEMIPQRVR